MRGISRRLYLASLFLALLPAGCAPSTPAPTATLQSLASPPAPTTAPSLPPAPTATSDPVQALETFARSLLEGINRRDASALQRLMRASFILGRHPVGSEGIPAGDAAFELVSRYLPERPSVTLLDAAASAPPMAGGDMGAAPGDEETFEVIYTAGWGLAGTGQGKLLVTDMGGAYSWAGLIVAYGGFEPLPELATLPLPAGLVYRLGDQIWRASASGASELLIEHPGPLSLNPGATLALSAEGESRSLVAYALPGGGAGRIIELEATLLQGAQSLAWLDDRTAVVVASPEPGPLTQGSTGYLTLVDVVEGRWTRLAPELSVYAQPAVGPGGAIAYDEAAGGGPHLWQAGEALPLDAGEQAGLFNPVPAPDGRRFAGLITGEFGPHTFAYAVVDLSSGESTLVHTFLPVPTDAAIPWGIAWSPDARWLALEPQSWDPVESGVWVVSPDAAQATFLGIGTASPVWISPARLAYSAIIEGERRLGAYDPVDGQRFWLDAPPGAIPLLHAPGPG